MSSSVSSSTIADLWLALAIDGALPLFVCCCLMLFRADFRFSENSSIEMLCLGGLDPNVKIQTNMLIYSRIVNVHNYLCHVHSSIEIDA